MAISLADHHDHRTQLESQSEATFRTVLFDSQNGAIYSKENMAWTRFLTRHRHKPIFAYIASCL